MLRLIFCIILILPLSLRADISLPSGCQPLALHGEIAHLKKSKQGSLYFIHNLIQSDLWLTPTDSTSENGTSHVPTDQWSAIHLAKKSFSFLCVESSPGHEQQVPCQGVIQICKWHKVKTPATLNKFFWLEEGMPLSQLEATIATQGFVLSP